MSSPELRLDMPEDQPHSQQQQAGSPLSPPTVLTIRPAPQAELEDDAPVLDAKEKRKKKKKDKKKKKQQQQLEGEEDDDDDPKNKKKGKKGTKRKLKKKKKMFSAEDGEVDSTTNEPLLGAEEGAEDRESDHRRSQDSGGGGGGGGSGGSRRTSFDQPRSQRQRRSLDGGNGSSNSSNNNSNNSSANSSRRASLDQPRSQRQRRSLDGGNGSSNSNSGATSLMNRPHGSAFYEQVYAEERAGEAEGESLFNRSSIVGGGGGGGGGGNSSGGGLVRRQRERVRLDKRRWLVLGVFCVAAFSAMLVWGAIAASPETAKSYYKMSADEVQLTRSWSIYFFPPLALVASWVLSLEKGVKYAVIGMGVFSCVGATIVLVPSFVGKVAGDVGGSAGKLGPTSGLGHFLVHLGQVVNSLATSMVFCAPCALSATWFPPYQRRRATAVGGLIPLMAGLTLGAVIAPHIANKPENFFWLLLIIFIISVVAMIATFVIPSLPTTPPSLTAARFRMAFASVAAPASSGAAWRRSTSSTSTSSSSSSSSAFSSSNIAAIAQHNLEDSRAGRAAERAVTSLRRSVARYISLFGPLKSQGPRRAAVVTFIAAMALSFGCLYVWQMSLTHVLISSKSAGTLGRANMLSLSHFVGGCAAAIVVSWACDLTFKRKARLIVCGAQLVFAFLTICLLGLCLCSPSAVPEFLISKEFVIFHLVCIGVTVGAATPLLYELCCETLYPIPEALALPLPAFFGSFICIIVAAVSPKISESSFGTVICSLSICETLVSTALICFGSFKLPYFRLDVDEGRCDTMEYQPF